MEVNGSAVLHLHQNFLKRVLMKSTKNAAAIHNKNVHCPVNQFRLLIMRSRTTQAVSKLRGTPSDWWLKLSQTSLGIKDIPNVQGVCSVAGGLALLGWQRLSVRMIGPYTQRTRSRLADCCDKHNATTHTILSRNPTHPGGLVFWDEY